MKNYYFVERVEGDGRFAKMARSLSKKKMCRRAIKSRALTGLWHTVTGLPIGAVRVSCPDGTFLTGIDIDLELI